MAKTSTVVRVTEVTKITLTALVFTAMVMLGTPEETGVITYLNESTSSLNEQPRKGEKEKDTDTSNNEFEVIFVDDQNRSLRVVLDAEDGQVKEIDDSNVT
ncbi:MAG: hypothetical protein ACK4SL_02710 [Candidatus Paceibacteria bacterium]